jgi:hypothetical protein
VFLLEIKFCQLFRCMSYNIQTISKKVIMKLQWTFPKIYNLGLGNGEVYMDLKLIHHYKKLGSI